MCKLWRFTPKFNNTVLGKKKGCVTGTLHNHIPQTSPWYIKEETLNTEKHSMNTTTLKQHAVSSLAR